MWNGESNVIYFKESLKVWSEVVRIKGLRERCLKGKCLVIIKYYYEDNDFINDILYRFFGEKKVF